jgi:hypothetical protein
LPWSGLTIGHFQYGARNGSRAGDICGGGYYSIGEEAVAAAAHSDAVRNVAEFVCDVRALREHCSGAGRNSREFPVSRKEFPIVAKQFRLNELAYSAQAIDIIVYY